MTAEMAVAVSRPGMQACLQAGDVAALEGLIAAHQKRVFRLALRMLGDLDEAATATQDCFLRAFAALDRCPVDSGGQQRWVARLAINLCLDRLRSRRWQWWRRRLALTSPESTGQQKVRSPERELLGRELGQQLARALDRLSPRQRAVFVLRHYEDYSLEQMAEHLSLNVGTVKAHLARALAALRTELKEFYGTRTPE